MANEVKTKLTADKSDLDAGLQGGLSSLKSFAGAAVGIGAALAIFAGLKKGMAEVIDLAKESIALFQVQEDAEVRAAAMLRATNRERAISIDRVKQFASELQLLTGRGDEETIAAAATLAKFTTISDELFFQVLETADDMAAQVGGSMESAINQIGRAVADPRSGIQLLRRSLGGLSVVQQNNIQMLIEAGRTAEAQAAILQILQDKYDGVAERMSKTTSGLINRLQGRLGDLKEDFGEAIVFAGGEIAYKAANEALTSIEDHIDEIAATTSAVVGFMAAYAETAWDTVKAIDELNEKTKRIGGFFPGQGEGGALEGVMLGLAPGLKPILDEVMDAINEGRDAAEEKIAVERRWSEFRAEQERQYRLKVGIAADIMAQNDSDAHTRRMRHAEAEHRLDMYFLNQIDRARQQEEKDRLERAEKSKREGRGDFAKKDRPEIESSFQASIQSASSLFQRIQAGAASDPQVSELKTVNKNLEKGAAIQQKIAEGIGMIPDKLDKIAVLGE